MLSCGDALPLLLGEGSADSTIFEDVCKGSEGEDWKCRSMVGRVNDGVGGTGMFASCGNALLLAAVWIVKPKLVGRRFGGLGAFEKDNDTMSMSGGFLVEEDISNDVVDAARPMPRVPVVLTAKFLRLRGRL